MLREIFLSLNKWQVWNFNEFEILSRNFKERFVFLLNIGKKGKCQICKFEFEGNVNKIKQINFMDNEILKKVNCC